MTTDHLTARRLSLVVAGRPRTATILGAPDAGGARPLVLVFHGSRQTGDVHRAVTGGALDDLARAGEAVVVYLDGYRGNWNDARRESRFPARREGIDDVAFTRAVIGRLRTSHGIDPARVVAVGYSNGGQFVMRLLHETPDEIAAGVVVAATMPVPESFLLPADGGPATRRPVVLVAGTRDPIIRFEGGRPAAWVRLVFRIDGLSRSARDTARYFAQRNGILAEPVTTEIPAGPDARGTRVERVDHRETGRPSVTLYVVHEGGHTVPGPTRGPALVGRTTGDVSIADLVREALAAAQETGASRSSSS